MQGTRTFADELRHAIDRRGLGLERIRDHLEQRGVSVSVATLSYWQSGRSEPARKSSLAALAHLEDVLALGPGELRRTLPLTPCRQRRTHAAQDLKTLWPEAAATAILASLDTGWDEDLERISLHDVVRIGPDRRQVSATIRQVLRARTDGPDRRVIIHCQDDATAPLPDIRVGRGCELGRIERSPDAGVIGAELLFFAPLQRNDTVILEYDLVFAVPAPFETEFTRRLRTPMREYLLEVEFHPEALPDSVAAFTDDCESAIDLDPSHRGHLVHTDATPGTTGMKWAWLVEDAAATEGPS